MAEAFPYADVFRDAWVALSPAATTIAQFDAQSRRPVKIPG